MRARFRRGWLFLEVDCMLGAGGVIEATWVEG